MGFTSPPPSALWQPTHCFSIFVAWLAGPDAGAPGSNSPTVPSSILYCGEWCGGRLELLQDAPRWLWHWAQILMFGLYLLAKFSEVVRK